MLGPLTLCLGLSIVWHAKGMLAAVLALRSGSHIAGIESPFGYKASTHTFVSQ